MCFRVDSQQGAPIIEHMVRSFSMSVSYEEWPKPVQCGLYEQANSNMFLCKSANSPG